MGAGATSLANDLKLSTAEKMKYRSNYQELQGQGRSDMSIKRVVTAVVMNDRTKQKNGNGQKYTAGKPSASAAAGGGTAAGQQRRGSKENSISSQPIDYLSNLPSSGPVRKERVPSVSNSTASGLAMKPKNGGSSTGGGGGATTPSTTSSALSPEAVAAVEAKRKKKRKKELKLKFRWFCQRLLFQNTMDRILDQLGPTSIHLRRVPCQTNKILYHSPVMFWRMKQSLDILMYHHDGEEVRKMVPGFGSLLEIIAFDAVAHKEVSRIFINHSILCNVLAELSVENTKAVATATAASAGATGTGTGTGPVRKKSLPAIRAAVNQAPPVSSHFTRWYEKITSSFQHSSGSAAAPRPSSRAASSSGKSSMRFSIIKNSSRVVMNSIRMIAKEASSSDLLGSARSNGSGSGSYRQNGEVTTEMITQAVLSWLVLEPAAVPVTGKKVVHTAKYNSIAKAAGEYFSGGSAAAAVTTTSAEDANSGHSGGDRVRNRLMGKPVGEAALIAAAEAAIAPCPFVLRLNCPESITSMTVMDQMNIMILSEEQAQRWVAPVRHPHRPKQELQEEFKSLLSQQYSASDDIFALNREAAALIGDTSATFTMEYRSRDKSRWKNGIYMHHLRDNPQRQMTIIEPLLVSAIEHRIKLLKKMKVIPHNHKFVLKVNKTLTHPNSLTSSASASASGGGLSPSKSGTNVWNEVKDENGDVQDFSRDSCSQSDSEDEGDVNDEYGGIF